MFETVAIPVWLIVVAGLLAAIGLVDRVLGPTIRWYFRRRFLRAVDRLNKRLQIEIQPFKLMRRRFMIERLTYDPSVMEAVLEQARKRDMTEELAHKEAERYAREIVPGFSAAAYFGFAIRLARWLSRTLYHVRLVPGNEDKLEAIGTEATVIFVMNHRSNMDYVLVTYLVAAKSALSYAVGEWARVWPLAQLIRAMGAYFIRRRSGDPLYRRVLARYVQLATEGGVTQAVFPEGGLSLDGSVGKPKLGLLNYVVSGFDPERSRDVVFVPVGLNYDRVLEDRILTRAHAAGERRFQFRFFEFLGFVWRQIRTGRAGRRKRFGYAAVAFGEPVSLKQVLECHKGKPKVVTEILGERLMAAVSGAIPALPVPILARVLIEAGGKLPRDEWLRRAKEMGGQNLSELGAEPFSGGAEIMLQRGLVIETDQVSANAKESELLEFYARAASRL